MARKAQQKKVRPAATPQAGAAAASRGIPPRLTLVICLVLAAAVLAIYGQTLSHGFVAYDDDQYVYENPMMSGGLSPANLAWAMTTFFYANWHPLTWVSYFTDVQFFGVSPGPMHAVNVLFHLASVILLFLALNRMTGQVWRSAVVAGILAVHPLHVESVAWISERKDVLCTFFEMLTLLLYLRYIERPDWRRYGWMGLAFACALMAKPMAVTFPFVLLLLDVWPLGRMGRPFEPAMLRSRLVEKLPLVAMAAIASVLTFQAQHGYGAVVELNRLPLGSRAANAAVSYMRYLAKAFWPAKLGVLYPSRPPATEAVLGGMLVLLAITAAAVLLFRSRPYILVGWLWYLGMLVPVIGLVQVGVQSMADRYAYLPLVGFSIAVVWGIADAAANHPPALRIGSAAAALWLTGFAVTAYAQTSYWKDSRTLFEHTLAVTDGNFIIENNLGVVLNRDGETKRAMALFERSMADSSGYADARANLAHALMRVGRFEEAEPLLHEAQRLAPRMAMAHGDLGLLLATRSNWEGARAEMEEALRLAPNDAEAASNLCFVLQRLGKIDAAIARCNDALRSKPDSPDARYNLGTALAAAGKKPEAAAEFQRVLAANPGHAGARAALENLKLP